MLEYIITFSKNKMFSIKIPIVVLEIDHTFFRCKIINTSDSVFWTFTSTWAINPTYSFYLYRSGGLSMIITDFCAGRKDEL